MIEAAKNNNHPEIVPIPNITKVAINKIHPIIAAIQPTTAIIPAIINKIQPTNAIIPTIMNKEKKTVIKIIRDIKQMIQ